LEDNGVYSANDMKRDLLANVKNNPKFVRKMYDILSYCEFQFNDSAEFTRIEWNTYTRNLVVFCPAEDRNILEESKEMLYQLSKKIHGNKDDYLLMSLEVIAKSELSKTSLTDHNIKIRKEIIIDRTPENELGKGGFGRVYKYYDEDTEEIYAYKIYEPSIFQNSDPEIMKKRFMREGKKLLHYSHENVVKAFDFGFLSDDSAYIKLEYIAGSRLIDYVKHSQLSMKQREDLCMQYISAMSYVHEKSDMHRDISYSNIMIEENNHVKVLDFGFARGKDDTDYDTKYKDIEHKFALPNESYSMKTEVYCIGAILFTIFTSEVFDRYKISELNEIETQTQLIEIIHKCLSEKPENRFENAIEIKKILFSGITESQLSISIYNDYSLDSFRDILSNGISIYFSNNCMPDFETINNWIEIDLKEIIESHMFLSQINILEFVKKLPNIDEIIEQGNISYYIDKKNYEDMYNYYNQLQPRLKPNFIKSILIIVLECSNENVVLPFQ